MDWQLSRGLAARIYPLERTLASRLLQGALDTVEQFHRYRSVEFDLALTPMNFYPRTLRDWNVRPDSTRIKQFIDSFTKALHKVKDTPVDHY